MERKWIAAVDGVGITSAPQSSASDETPMVVIIPGLTSDSDDAVNFQDTRPRPSYVLFQSQYNVRINSFQSCFVEIFSHNLKFGSNVFMAYAMGEFGGNSM